MCQIIFAPNRAFAANSGTDKLDGVRNTLSKDTRPVRLQLITVAQRFIQRLDVYAADVAISWEQRVSANALT